MILLLIPLCTKERSMASTRRLLRGARGLPRPGDRREFALLVEEGRIRSVGSEGELQRDFPGAEEVDLRGAILLPGFIDTHTHLFEWARRICGIDLDGISDPARLREELLQQRRAVDDGREWIGGSGWDPVLARKGLDRALLDEIFGRAPVVLQSRDFHTMWCSTEALRRAGVFEGAAPPPGGEIGRRPDGSPDGLLYETAWELILRAQPPEKEEIHAAWIDEAVRRAHRFGLTGVHSMEPDATRRSYLSLARQGRLKMRVVHHTPLSSLDELIAGVGKGEPVAEEWVMQGGVKIFMDGSLGSRTAYMEDPYPHGGRGRLLLEKDQLTEIVMRAARAGIPPSIHAIGDACVETVIEALGEAKGELAKEGLAFPTDARIEHLQFISDRALSSLARLGLTCAMQPIHLADDVPLLLELDETTGRRAYRTRSLLDRGIRVVLGSDAPVASIDPRQGICAAMSRRAGNRPEGIAWHPEEALSAAEALAGYTIEAAAACGATREWGSLRPGKRADLVAVVLAGGSEDPFAWRDAEVRMTMVDGEIVYDGLL